MKCLLCNAEIDEGTSFCPECRNKVGLESAPSSEEKNSSQKLVFTKIKQVGRISYKTFLSTVTVDASELQISLSTKKIFRKEKIVEKNIQIFDIQSIRKHTVMDFWDTLYAIFFVILGFFYPLWFLPALLYLWSAYGKEIELTLSNSEKVKIPYEGRVSEKVDALFSICGKNQ